MVPVRKLLRRRFSVQRPGARRSVGTYLLLSGWGDLAEGALASAVYPFVTIKAGVGQLIGADLLNIVSAIPLIIIGRRMRAGLSWRGAPVRQEGSAQPAHDL
jgi:hypothetical protein